MPARWLVVGIFVLSSTLNYLDRQILAALAPVIKDEFRLTNAEYGQVLAAFSIAYAVCAPMAGLLIDRFGLNRGISAGVALWSLAGMATGLVNSFQGLLVCRAALGAAESSGIPASGKAFHTYLPPKERALGPALNQVGLSLGAVLAPPLATWIALRHGWRAAFIAAGAAGFLWIPLWLWAARKAPRLEDPAAGAVRVSGMLAGRLLWGMVAANVLSMTVYTLWTNWTTLYLQAAHQLTLEQANRLAPYPFAAAYAGGLFGGWLSMRWISRGELPLRARRHACLTSALLVAPTAAVPWMPSPEWTTAAISLSFFAVTSFSVNLYTMPLDAFGPRAAFGVSMLTFAYGAMQAAASPLIGATVDRYGFAPAILAVSLLPAAAWLVLAFTQRRS
ncbi:MAG: MFS transporter [Bryobacteraceae bacterium]|nr:MFS transporter [Bryobacteraceae bacterium]